MTGFQRLNTRSAKVNGEQVMWIRRQYAMMLSYPAIRAGLRDKFGVVLSIQQITRIAKGESFAQMPMLPTEREVDLTMQVNALRGAAGPSEAEAAASFAKFQELLAKENEPKPGVLEILENRTRVIPTLEEIEERERAVMGVSAGSGLDRLMKTAEARPAKKPNAERLLETLKDETQKTRD